jgi:phage terminase small subunit
VSAGTTIEPQTSPLLLDNPHSERKSSHKLPIKVRKFITEYLRTGNATSSAIKVGYTPKSAHKTASRLVNDKVIKAEIDAQLALQAEESGLSVAYVLKRFKEIADAEDTRNADRVAALSYIGKHLNMFTERREIDAKITITVERIGG